MPVPQPELAQGANRRQPAPFRQVIHERHYINNIDLPNWFVDPDNLEEFEPEEVAEEDDFGLAQMFQEAEEPEQAVKEEVVEI